VKKWKEGGEYCIMRSIITCTLHLILLRRSSQGGCDGRDMGEMRSAYRNLVGKLGGDHSEDQGVRVKIMDWIHLAQDRYQWVIC